MNSFESPRNIHYVRLQRSSRLLTQVICVDGTFLHGKYRGTLLFASAQDANIQIFPLAFAVVDSENDLSWGWFFRQMTNVVADSSDLVFVSDRHRSISKGVEASYSLVRHVYCIWHMKQNIKARFKRSELVDLFMRAAVCYRQVEFNDLFTQIRQLHPQLASYLEEGNVEKWSRAYFPGNR